MLKLVIKIVGAMLLIVLLSCVKYNSDEGTIYVSIDVLTERIMELIEQAPNHVNDDVVDQISDQSKSIAPIHTDE